MEFFKATTRVKGIHLKNAIDVSTHGEKPYSKFSPFNYSSNFQIPVPGKEETFSNSVEGIWQGLKVIDGVTDETLFIGKPEKRKKGQYQGHEFGEKLIKIVEAREKIYKPAYKFFFNTYIEDIIKESIISIALKQKEPVRLYDMENNIHPNDSGRALAHSFYLAQFLNEQMNEEWNLIAQTISELYGGSKFEHETIAEPASRVLAMYESNDEKSKLYFEKIINADNKDNNINRFYAYLRSRL